MAGESTINFKDFNEYMTEVEQPKLNAVSTTNTNVKKKITDHITRTDLHISETDGIREFLNELHDTFGPVEININGAMSYYDVEQYLRVRAGGVADPSTETGRTGKIFGTRLYNGKAAKVPGFERCLNSTVTEVPNKLWDNVDKVHFCSTDLIENRDDYTEFPFFWEECNYVKDGNGIKHISYIRGKHKLFSKTNEELDVGVFGPKFYFNICEEVYQDENGNWYNTDPVNNTGTNLYYIWVITDKPYHELSAENQAKLTEHGIHELFVWPECFYIDPTDGVRKERPYWIHAKYHAWRNDKGVFKSVAHKSPTVNISAQSVLDSLDYKTKGGRSEVFSFGLLFDIIKNATKDIKSIHAGCYNDMGCFAAVETADTSNYFPVTKAQADLIPIHASVRIGTTKNGNYVFTDDSYLSNIYCGFVTDKTEVVDDDGNILYVKIYTDSKKTSWKCTQDFAKASATGGLRAYILHVCLGISGETDFIRGKHDGYIGESNTAYRMYRVMGTEYNPGVGCFALDSFGYISKENVTATKYIPYSYTSSGKQDERTETFDIKIDDFVLQSAMPGVELNNKGLGYNNIATIQRTPDYGGLTVIDLTIDPATGIFYPLTLRSGNFAYKLNFKEWGEGCTLYGKSYGSEGNNLMTCSSYSFAFATKAYRD